MNYVFGIFIIYFILIEPFLEFLQYRKFKTNQNTQTRIALYQQAFRRNWILTLLILLTAIFYNVPFSALGFKAFNFSQFATQPILMQGIMVLIVLAYFIYFYLYVILPIISERGKNWVAKKLLVVAHLTPETSKEKLWWTLNSITAAAEEIMYRSFIFLALPILFLHISIYLVIFLAAAIDAIRYIHRPIAIFYVFFSGLAFAILYFITGSIWIPMLVHVLHDFRALLMPLKLMQEKHRQQEAEA